MDEALRSKSSATRGQLVKMLITLEPRGICWSNFAYFYILTLSRHWYEKKRLNARPFGVHYNHCVSPSDPQSVHQLAVCENNAHNYCPTLGASGGFISPSTLFKREIRLIHHNLYGNRKLPSRNQPFHSRSVYS